MVANKVKRNDEGIKLKIMTGEFMRCNTLIIVLYATEMTHNHMGQKIVFKMMPGGKKIDGGSHYLRFDETKNWQNEIRCARERDANVNVVSFFDQHLSQSSEPTTRAGGEENTCYLEITKEQ